MPSIEDPDDARLSEYSVQKHHRVIAATLEAVERGEIKRLIITMPPRHGKSELASKRFPAWCIGRNPNKHIILASYNDDLAKEFGRKVRDIVGTKTFGQIFPQVAFTGHTQASDRLETTEGGVTNFVGAGGAITGKGADILLIDDPVKNQEEADSQTFRDRQWGWFNSTAMSRLHGDKACVVIIMTRWHEDDLVGRLTDSSNDYYTKEEASKWKILNLPAIAVDNDPMGREEGEALWPEKYSIDFLNSQKIRDPRIFSALYQCSPAPPDGIFFLRKHIKTYKPGDLPKNLQKYCASDHAVATKQHNDRTAIIPFGVDQEGIIWILPDVVWGRMDTMKQVNTIITMIQTHSPLAWYAEKGHISKSIGPFLKERQVETGAYCFISELTPVSDKETRAQSMRGRIQLGRVRFPNFVPWWADALDEMLKFPAGSKDDFVDCLSLIGLALNKQVGASKPKKKKTEPESGTMGWLKSTMKAQRLSERRAKRAGF